MGRAHRMQFIFNYNQKSGQFIAQCAAVLARKLLVAIN